MKKTRLAGVTGVALAALLVAPAAAQAAQPSTALVAKKPAVGLTVPDTVKVGEPVTVKSVFKAKTKGCFAPYVQWGDEEVSIDTSNGNYPAVGMCIKNSSKAKFTTERDTHRHTYTEPGIYTIQVDAAAIPNGGAMVTSKGVKTKGKDALTATITVTGPNGEMPTQAVGDGQLAPSTANS